MNRRLQPTLADYIALAINPVLIMGLIGSLVYFLLEILYQGIYPERLHFCLSMFVMAIVLISRISMEEGFAHALPFGIAMAVVEALALARFVTYQPGPLATFGWIVNWGLMALVWWCAYKLTWDCTEIDETEEAGDKGLLETVGLDRPEAATDAAEQADLEKLRQAQRPKRVLNRWEKLLSRPEKEKQKPHAPGVWVVYFSLASLPIFGLGQLLIPATNTASRRYVFLLLAMYVACGLGLLLTTSFVSLRRYLRQRRMEMPPVMAGTWLATGSAMIVVLLLLAACLPRPYPEYAISELSFRGPAESRSTSQYAVGKKGERDAQAESAPGVDHDRAAPEPPQGTGGQQPGSSDKEARQGEQTQEPGQQQGQASQEGEAAGQQHTQGESSGQGKSSNQGQSSEQGQSSKQSQSSEKGQASQQGKSSQQDQASGSQQSNNEKASQGTQADRSQASQPPKPAHSSPAARPPAPPWSFTGLLAALGLGLVKLLVYGAAIVAICYALWHYRQEVRAFLRQLLDSWWDFWRTLFGGSRATRQAASEAAVLNFQNLRTFADFADPFAGQTAHQFAPKELVKYTFAALEAWAADHGAPKQPEQTPHEFAGQLGAQAPALAPSSRALADLYCRAVYAQGALPAKNFDQLARLWQLMSAMRPTVVGEDVVVSHPSPSGRG